MWRGISFALIFGVVTGLEIIRNDDPRSPVYGRHIGRGNSSRGWSTEEETEIESTLSMIMDHQGFEELVSKDASEPPTVAFFARMSMSIVERITYRFDHESGTLQMTFPQVDNDNVLSHAQAVTSEPFEYITATAALMFMRNSYHSMLILKAWHDALVAVPKNHIRYKSNKKESPNTRLLIFDKIFPGISSWITLNSDLSYRPRGNGISGIINAMTVGLGNARDLTKNSMRSAYYHLWEKGWSNWGSAALAISGSTVCTDLLKCGYLPVHDASNLFPISESSKIAIEKFLVELPEWFLPLSEATVGITGAVRMLQLLSGPNGRERFHGSSKRSVLFALQMFSFYYAGAMLNPIIPIAVEFTRSAWFATIVLNELPRAAHMAYKGVKGLFTWIKNALANYRNDGMATFMRELTENIVKEQRLEHVMSIYVGLRMAEDAVRNRPPESGKRLAKFKAHVKNLGLFEVVSFKRSRKVLTVKFPKLQPLAAQTVPAENVQDGLSYRQFSNCVSSRTDPLTIRAVKEKPCSYSEAVLAAYSMYPETERLDYHAPSEKDTKFNNLARFISRFLMASTEAIAYPLNFIMKLDKPYRQLTLQAVSELPAAERGLFGAKKSLIPFLKGWYAVALFSFVKWESDTVEQNQGQTPAARRQKFVDTIRSFRVDAYDTDVLVEVAKGAIVHGSERHGGHMKLPALIQANYWRAPATALVATRAYLSSYVSITPSPHPHPDSVRFLTLYTAYLDGTLDDRVVVSHVGEYCRPIESQADYRNPSVKARTELLTSMNAEHCALVLEVIDGSTPNQEYLAMLLEYTYYDGETHISGSALAPDIPMTNDGTPIASRVQNEVTFHGSTLKGQRHGSDVMVSAEDRPRKTGEFKVLKLKTVFVEVEYYLLSYAPRYSVMISDCQTFSQQMFNYFGTGGTKASRKQSIPKMLLQYIKVGFQQCCCGCRSKKNTAHLQVSVNDEGTIDEALEEEATNPMRETETEEERTGEYIDEQSHNEKTTVQTGQSIGEEDGGVEVAVTEQCGEIGPCAANLEMYELVEEEWHETGRKLVTLYNEDE